MRDKNILILDYSVDQIEAPAIKRWLPAEAQVTALFIDTEESFPDDLLAQGFTHVIHSGSSLSITEEAPFSQRAENFIRGARDYGTAQFGICYGHQLVCRALVGKHAVRSSPKGLEVGWGEVTFTDHAREILGVGETETIWQSHFDEVTEMPEGSILLAANSHSEIQAYINHEQKILGTQFHPEFDKEAGDQLYRDERDMLEKHHRDVDEIVRKSPTIDAGKIFFGYFGSAF